MSEQIPENNSEQFSISDLVERRFSDAYWKLHADYKLFGVNSAEKVEAWLKEYISREILPLHDAANKTLVGKFVDMYSADVLFDNSFLKCWVMASPYWLAHPVSQQNNQPYEAQLYLGDSVERARLRLAAQKLKNYALFAADPSDIPLRISKLYKEAPFSLQLEPFELTGAESTVLDAEPGTQQVVWDMPENTFLYANNSGLPSFIIFNSESNIEDFDFGFRHWRADNYEPAAKHILGNIGLYHAEAEYKLSWAQSTNLTQIVTPTVNAEVVDEHGNVSFKTPQKP